MSIQCFVPAFKEILVRSQFNKDIGEVRLYEFEHTDRYVVRRGDTALEAKQLTTAVESCLHVKGLYDELRVKYSILSPTQFVVANTNDGSPAFYILTEKVFGSRFKDLKGANRKIAAQEMADIFSCVIAYYEDKARTGEDFLNDLPETEQYIYGCLEGQTEQKWYLVDTDPYFSHDSKDL